MVKECRRYLCFWFKIDGALRTPSAKGEENIAFLNKDMCYRGARGYTVNR